MNGLALLVMIMIAWPNGHELITVKKRAVETKSSRNDVR